MLPFTSSKKILLLFFVGIAASCVPPLHNLSVADLSREPTIEVYEEPTANFFNSTTFTVFPASLIDNESGMNEILEKQTLFALRNYFEMMGYQFVSLDSSWDFAATIRLSSEYKQSYVPPTSLTLPKYVPGKTKTTTGSTSGSVSLNTFGDYSSYGWGTYSGTTTSTEYEPGYYTTQTLNLQGYTTGAYYPTVSVSVYDGKSLERTWLAIGVGTSKTSDVRVSSQLVLLYEMTKFPSAQSDKTEASDDGVIGIVPLIFTNDGNNYYPTVLRMVEGGPARMAGLKLYDMIVDIDGTSTRNKPYSEVMELLSGEPGSVIRMRVKRLDEIHSLSIVRVPRTSIY